MMCSFWICTSTLLPEGCRTRLRRWRPGVYLGPRCAREQASAWVFRLVLNLISWVARFCWMTSKTGLVFLAAIRRTTRLGRRSLCRWTRLHRLPIWMHLRSLDKMVDVRWVRRHVLVVVRLDGWVLTNPGGCLRSRSLLRFFDPGFWQLRPCNNLVVPGLVCHMVWQWSRIVVVHEVFGNVLLQSCLCGVSPWVR